jgi:YkoY family integral membrane protein
MVQQWNDLIAILTEHPLNALFLILGIILLEVILSFDNAAVLATMVKDLSPEDQSKALRYGILGAYVFRGVALVLVDVILGIWWLKPIGGIYLLYMAFKHFYDSAKEKADEEVKDTKQSFLYKYTVGILGVFWSTVLAVEFMDIVFSIDNIFAVVAYSENILLICIGVFIGILAMRYVAKYFVVLMEKFPFLEKSAFIVIGILVIKLCFSVLVHFGESDFTKGQVNLVQVNKNKIIEQFDLKSKKVSINPEGDLILRPTKVLPKNTNYKLVFQNGSEDIKEIEENYLGEDKIWTFKTGTSLKSKKDMAKKRNVFSAVYPLDNSEHVSRKLTFTIKNNNQFKWIESEAFDLFVSILTLLIFILPIVAFKVMNKRKVA